MDSQADTHEVTEGGSPKDECISSVSADNEKPFVLETPCQLSKQRSLQDPDQLSTTQNSKETGLNSNLIKHSLDQQGLQNECQTAIESIKLSYWKYKEEVRMGKLKYRKIFDVLSNLENETSILKKELETYKKCASACISEFSYENYQHMQTITFPPLIQVAEYILRLIGLRIATWDNFLKTIEESGEFARYLSFFDYEFAYSTKQAREVTVLTEKLSFRDNHIKYIDAISGNLFTWIFLVNNIYKKIGELKALKRKLAKQNKEKTKLHFHLSDLEDIIASNNDKLAKYNKCIEYTKNNIQLITDYQNRNEENESEMWGITDKCNAALLLIKEEFTTFVIKKRPSLIISNLPMLYSSEISPRCPYISEGECTPIDQRFRASSFNPKDEFPNNNGLPLITEPDLEISHIDCDVGMEKKGKVEDVTQETTIKEENINNSKSENSEQPMTIGVPICNRPNTKKKKRKGWCCC